MNNKLSVVPANGISDVDYVNVSMHSTSNIGRKLSPNSTFNAIDTLIGRITCLRSAMAYIVTPGYPVRLLTKNKILGKDIKKIPKATIGIPNYWAVVTHLTYERIKQDHTLLADFIELPKGIVFTSFNTKKHTVSSITSSVTTYNHNYAQLASIISSIHDIMLTYKRGEWDGLILKLMTDNKTTPSKGIFDDLPFEVAIEIDEL